MLMTSSGRSRLSTILLKAGSKPGSIKMAVKAKGLQSAELIITTE